jgi:ammonium transporter Rh
MFGAVIGKTSIWQMLTLEIFLVITYSLNFAICWLEYGASDIGGSMFIHTFGAYFGLAASLVISHKKPIKEGDKSANEACYHSDLFSMIGTIFLWCFWPSFNGALGVGN